MIQSQYRHHYFSFWLLVGFFLVITVIYLSLTSNTPEIVGIIGSDKIGHLTAYTVLMGWFGQLFTRKYQLVALAIGFCLMGVSMEFLQRMGGHRMFEYGDMLANTLGVLLGWLLTRTIFSGFLHWVERRLGVGG